MALPLFKHKTHIGNLRANAGSLTLARLFQEDLGFTLLICQNSLEAQQYLESIPFFLGDDSIPVLSFSDWETLPYDQFSPHQSIVSERLMVLSKLPDLKKGIVVTHVTALLQKIIPKSYLYAHYLVLHQGETYDLEKLCERFVEAGYSNTKQVFEPGEFAKRGAILDVYPTGGTQAYRLEFDDEDIASIRTFDPETQRSLQKIEAITILPAREFPTDPAHIRYFLNEFSERFDLSLKQCPITRDMKTGIFVPGTEYYLPLFFETLGTFFDYLPEHTRVVKSGDLELVCKQFWAETQTRYEMFRLDLNRPALPPQLLFLREDEFFAQLNAYPQLTFSKNAFTQTDDKHVNLAFDDIERLSIQTHHEHPMQKVKLWLSTHDARVLFCGETEGRCEVLKELLKSVQLTPSVFESFSAFYNSQERFGLCIAPLEESVFDVEAALIVLAETTLFGQRVMQRRRRSKRKLYDPDIAISHLAELKIQDPVVHKIHGIGRYLGLQTLTIDERIQEFVTLEYAENNKLYVPVTQLHQISRYSAANLEQVLLHRLGSNQFEKEKKKAQEKIKDVAAQLLELYAKRASKHKDEFAIDMAALAEFSAGFPFEETPDQLKAIEDVVQDLHSPKPMDRLICGDVGFGKTEVAMRAAFIAVQAGKQVAILVPTTLLAQQHYQSFVDRFVKHPIKIELLSRFRTEKEQKAVIEQAKQGKVDIVIGTHKLLQNEIGFKNLGLMIIDEEHRFGVQQKEKFKALRNEIDILTLTATPIPRTLNLAMSQLRDLSIIATPPARRLNVKTFVHERSDGLTIEAVLRELRRGGQVFYLFNDVEHIYEKADELSKLIPEARVVVAHGQMRERELEQVMMDFYHHRSNVLVCTTIIETGIDIPSANTIIMERADKLGLAQLHQLRGRVGRSHHQAYAYLFTPPTAQLTEDSKKRLEAIVSLESLGAGFTLATHDLEIRGAGELLGEGQSGHIQGIGFTLYLEMLEETVAALKLGKIPDLTLTEQTVAEVELRIPALIPDAYVPDVNQRLILYKRISAAKNDDALYDLQAELTDRFGLLPKEVVQLFLITQIKLRANVLGIVRIDCAATLKIEFCKEPKFEPIHLISMIQKDPNQFRLEAGGMKLIATKPPHEPRERVQYVQDILARLEGSV